MSANHIGEPGQSLIPGTDYKIVAIDELRSALFLTGNHRIFLISPDLGRRLEGGIANLNEEESREWSALERSGLLTDSHKSRLSRSSYSDGANLAININLTGACNLACTYCFAEGGDYGRIYQKMESHTIDYIFEFVRKHVTASRKVRFEFFGGEPLLNFPIIAEACRRSEEVFEEIGIEFLNRISTNLTVLPAGAVDLFHDRNFVVSVSIDGGPTSHNRNRPTKGGKESFSGILENCFRIRERGDRVTLVARMTVTSATPSLTENVIELYEKNLFDYFQIYPAVTSAGTCGGQPKLVQLQPANSTESPRASGPTMSSDFLSQFVDFMRIYPRLFSEHNRFKGVLEYERIAEMLLDGKMALGFCGGGGTYFTFSPDDSIMPCHRLVGDTKFQVGSGADGLTCSTSDWTLPVDAHPVCSQCWARYVCGGNCRQENYIATGDLRVLNKDTCTYQQNLLEHVIRIVAGGSDVYRGRQRRLDDLFVSCGRPVASSLRDGHAKDTGNLSLFRLVQSPVPDNPKQQFGELL